MRHSDDLFQLIKSLSKSEKRYFKMFAAMRKGEKKYLLLFDAIDRQEVYDETALKEEFRNERFVRQLGVAKGYLYNLVLKSLRIQKSESGASAQIRSMLQNVELLTERGLRVQARKILERAIETATEHEHFLELIEAVGWEEALAPLERSSTERINQHAWRLRRAIEKLHNSIEYGVLLRRVSHPLQKDYLRGADDFREIEQVMEHPLLKDETMALSLRARGLYHWTHCSYHFARNEPQKALEHGMRVVELIEAQPARLVDKASYYLSMLRNVLTLQKRCLDDEGFKRTMAKIKSQGAWLLQQNRTAGVLIRSELFVSTYFVPLSFHISMAEFEECVRMAPQIEAGLESSGLMVEEHIRYKFLFNLSYAYFALGDFQRALHYNNRIVMEQEPLRGESTYYAARLFNLIIHFELENIDLLERLVPATYRYLLSRSSAFQFETLVLEFFRQLPGVSERSDLIELFLFLRDRMIELQDDPQEQNAFRYFGYVEWLESKILRRPFIEIAQKYHLRRTDGPKKYDVLRTKVRAA